MSTFFFIFWQFFLILRKVRIFLKKWSFGKILANFKFLQENIHDLSKHFICNRVKTQKVNKNIHYRKRTHSLVHLQFNTHVNQKINAIRVYTQKHYHQTTDIIHDYFCNLIVSNHIFQCFRNSLNFCYFLT